MKNQDSENISLRSIFMLVLSIYVLSALLVDTFFDLPSEVSKLINSIDFFICFIFLGDFFYSLFKAENKIHFLKWGWIDLVSSIPEIQELRWGRLARVIKILRLLRGIRSTKAIIQFIFRKRAQGTFMSVALISFVLVIFSSIAILTVETTPDSNIKTPADAIWWSFVTITTVGYGDMYPITITGRIIAAILMTAGVGLFGTFTAFVASYFIDQDESEPEQAKQIKALEKENKELKKQLIELQGETSVG